MKTAKGVNKENSFHALLGFQPNQNPLSMPSLAVEGLHICRYSLDAYSHKMDASFDQEKAALLKTFMFESRLGKSFVVQTKLKFLDEIKDKWALEQRNRRVGHMVEEAWIAGKVWFCIKKIMRSSFFSVAMHNMLWNVQWRLNNLQTTRCTCALCMFRVEKPKGNVRRRPRLDVGQNQQWFEHI